VPAAPLATDAVGSARLASWYRRLVDTRAADGAERVLATAVAVGTERDDVEAMMFAAVTDHVFVDGGHTIDFTNKAFEALAHTGGDAAGRVLPALVRQTAEASRAEESFPWRHPRDLVQLLDGTMLVPGEGSFRGVSDLAWELLADDPDAVVGALSRAAGAGADAEQLARAVAHAAALRILRFHVQNDFGDWDQVHHTFTAAHAVHQAIRRSATPELLRGLVQCALRVYLDRFLNVPAARVSDATTGDLTELRDCWDTQGEVDRAGAIVMGAVRGGTPAPDVVRALGHAVFTEDPGFHWIQLLEAGAGHARAWPDGSEEVASTLGAVARFVAAHTPTRRELATVVSLAGRLRRGESLVAPPTHPVPVSD
jgi:hypothetical protein